MPKRILSGKVVKKSGDKTISVLVTRQTTHPVYKKIIRVSKKYIAHDESNKIILGDIVKITETKPRSKRKSWEVIL
ncbi:MAG: 30S ribosomal protein S17 [Pelagibacteraceae bacterium]|nr:30S ribosomal protein S17 [Pelagibacteraceae bacterium]|tara:strand:+ start:170 stop:397 length:228 start_codon:yes stop_codon:yes gene_type:complete